jgi:hypothetical protein
MPDMTCFTVGDGMRSHQCKTARRMQLKIILLVSPVATAVALLAVLAELPLMLISMTVNATGAHMTEDRALVAANAGCGLMRSDQLESSFTMIKCEIFANFAPRVGHVAILTIPLQFPVRIFYRRLTHDQSADYENREYHQQQEALDHFNLPSCMASP